MSITSNAAKGAAESARVIALRAELATVTTERDESRAHVALLRTSMLAHIKASATSNLNSWIETSDAMQAALAATPADALREHDAELTRRVLEEAAALCERAQGGEGTAAIKAAGKPEPEKVEAFRGALRTVLEES